MAYWRDNQSDNIDDANVQGRQAVAATAAALASGAAYKHWLIWPDAGAADTHYRFTTAGTAATTSYPKLAAADTMERHFDTAQKCSMIGAAATGSINVVAW